MKHYALTAAALAAAALLSMPSVQAMGVEGGPAVRYASIQGKLGEVIVNPYKVAPLTAIIKNGGYELKSATVRIVPNKGVQVI